MKKVNSKLKRRIRNRKKLKDVSNNKYRISIKKSLNNFSAQIIDDLQKTTLVSASSIEKDLKSKKIKKIEKSNLIGEILDTSYTENLFSNFSENDGFGLVSAKKAFEDLKGMKHNRVKKVLDNYNQSLLKNTNTIIRENLKDVKNVKRKHLVDRLILNKQRIEGIRHSINEIARFRNPVGRVLEKWRRPNNLTIKKVTTPIGVIGVIYESRPNVTADVAALCLKSGNCSILRGGSEAFNSNKLLANLFRDVLKKNNINQNCVQFIENKIEKL